ncbi:hypothetical protein BC939DRAFT_436535 [Gamsiella multidivaricata]|uniref:uncharacterized protein n=1 Tax=Gamsiella multidivaricata TaxID=101098 RepID=UPI00221E9801|nr:uncharacterized protein BC939DRAFT_436535 [Gamsiella multidivaricata]KAI7831772.1 hypothetical protein BC939DRAFT_436535 [Gamsiella multidivaricata]
MAYSVYLLCPLWNTLILGAIVADADVHLNGQWLMVRQSVHLVHFTPHWFTLHGSFVRFRILSFILYLPPLA